MASLGRLSGKVANQVQSAQVIPSIDVLVGSLVLSSIASSATRIEIDFDPTSYTLLVVDNGATIREKVWKTIGFDLSEHVRARVLHAVATFSTLAVTNVATSARVERKIIHQGRELPPTKLPISDDERPSPGVTVSVSHLFANYPVRRRQLSAMSTEQVVRDIHRRVLEIALSNSRTCIIFSSAGNIELRSPGKALTSELLCKLLPPARSNWRHLYASNANSRVAVSGYVAARSLSRCTRDFQLVAVQGIPLNADAKVHQMVMTKVRAYFNERNKGVNALLYPAYVLNVACNVDDLTMTAYEYGASVLAHRYLDIQRWLADCVVQLVCDAHPLVEKENVGASCSKIRTEYRRFVSDLTVKDNAEDGKSLKLLQNAVRQLTSKSTIDKRRPVSGGAHARRPLSATELRRKRKYDNVARPQSSSKLLKRPRSAQDVEKITHRTAPGWQNPIYRRQQGGEINALARPRNNRSRSGAFGRIRSSPFALGMSHVKVDKDMLMKMRVVGTVDRKFVILVDHTSMLYALDQHAASERVHFENLLNAVRTGTASRKLNRPFVLSVSHAQLCVLQTRRRVVERWGWRFDRLGDVRRPHVRVTGAPRVPGTDTTLDDPSHLLELLDALADNAPAVATPDVLVKALASFACHSAIRFGDKLSDVQCVKLIEHLATCDTPFACAHGRPSIVPLARISVAHRD